MRYMQGKRILALVAGLATAAAGSASAQDTTETGRATIDTTAPEGGAIDTGGVDTSGVDTSATRDTTDTSGVQNPPGYRGMERDTTVFLDSAGPPASPGAVEDRATGTYDDSTWQDTTGAEQNPAGYRGMGRLKGDSTEAGDTTAAQAPDTTQ